MARVQPRRDGADPPTEPAFVYGAF